MLGINSNINSLVAQQNLTSSGSALSQAITRLSSGKRINSAADDAAGLAISNIMQTQINGLNQGVSNANNGVSMVQTASSGLSSLTSSLQTIRQLATQASDGSMTDTDRQALQQEVAQQIQEVNRIASQTTYNGMNVLNGSLGNVSFQVGANVGQTISLNLSQNMSAAQIGSGVPAAGNTLGTYTNLSLNSDGTQYSGAPITSVTATADSTGAITYTDQSGNVIGTQATSTGPISGTGAAAINKANAAYEAANGTGNTLAADAVTAQGLNGGSVTTSGLSLNSDGTTAEITSVTATSTDGSTVTYTDQNGNTISNTAGSAGAAAISAAKAAYAAANPSGTLDGDAEAAYNSTGPVDGVKTQTGLAIDASTGNAWSNSTIAAITQINVLSDGNGGFTFTDQNNTALTATQIQNAGFTITGGGGTGANATAATLSNSSIADAKGNSESSVTSSINSLNAPSTVANIDISTQAGASAAMESIDNALNTVDNLQATLGAAQNRFTAITTTQQAQSTDLSSAQSSIQDADFAQETANLSKAQVLQQAGISVLAQANSQPQQILKLLQ